MRQVAVLELPAPVVGPQDAVGGSARGSSAGVAAVADLPLPLPGCGALAFEFAEFHAPPPGADGQSPMCPRCARSVPGPHGICPICSEVGKGVVAGPFSL